MNEVVGFPQKGGVVHRDTTPRNVAITCSSSLKLPDSRLAKLEREAMVAGVAGDVVVETSAYLSSGTYPHHSASSSFDPWILDLAFHEVMTGRQSFEADSREGLICAIKDGK